MVAHMKQQKGFTVSNTDAFEKLIIRLANMFC